MDLSPTAPRRKLHNRQINIEGFEREDGLFDIDAEILDTKTYDMESVDRIIPSGAPLHRMRARLTVNLDFEIVHAEAATVNGPLDACPGGAASFASLTGLTIKSGFIRAANERVGGVLGCTHIREMLQQMATVALQTTISAVRARREAQGAAASGMPTIAPVNSCFAFDSKGELVRTRFPSLYTGDKPV